MQTFKNALKNHILYLAVILVYFVVQLLVAGNRLPSLYEGLLVPICTYIILAVSLNLTVGFLGELSLGHAGFMCVGAFSGAFFSITTASAIPSVWIRFPLALLLGGVVAAVFGILVGVPILRLHGDYLAIVTLAFGEIIKNICNVLYVGTDKNGIHVSLESSMALNLDPESGKVIIKGAQGISGMEHFSNFTVGVILILITLFVVLHLVHSRAGRAIMAVRDNRIAAESVGVSLTKYRLLAFSVSAFLAGVAGVLYAHNLATVTATTQTFGYNMSIMILVFVVLGGIGRVGGSIIAAAVLTILPEMLRGLQNYRMLIYAIVLILMMLFTSSPQLIALREKIFPKGIFKKLLRSRKERGA